jgi:reactive intermediate/imine deaminase
VSKQAINTDEAPAAIGTYSQAVRHGDLVFLSGQIPLEPNSMEVTAGDIDAQIRQVFDNLSAVCKAAGGSLNSILKLSVFLTNMNHFPRVNEIMADYFDEPYPARAAIGVAQLPRGVAVEMDAIMAS